MIIFEFSSIFDPNKTHCSLMTLIALDNVLFSFVGNIDHSLAHATCHHWDSAMWRRLVWWWHLARPYRRSYYLIILQIGFYNGI